MPSGTELQTFINDLREGKSKVCRAFDYLFGTKEAIDEWKKATGKLNGDWPSLSTPTPKPFWPSPGPGVGGGPPVWVDQELRGNRPSGGSKYLPANLKLTDKDIGHVTEWPEEQKEYLRATVVEAITKGRLVQFWWRLWDGVNSEIEVKDSDDESAIQVTFLTPRTKVIYQAAKAAGQVDEVDIGI